MVQVTWRGDEALLRRIRGAAAARGWSVNGWMTRVFEAATDPDLAETETERIRERLRIAGLLEEVATSTDRPAEALVARARKATRKGAALSDLVVADRR